MIRPRHVMALMLDHMKPHQPSSRIVKIGELKNRLSHYLRRVQQGESILVADRDRVIARIERVAVDSALPTSDAEWLERLERRGIVRRGTGKLSQRWIAARPQVGADVVGAVLRDREDGR